MYHRRIPICEGNPFRRDKSILVDKHRKLQGQIPIHTAVVATLVKARRQKRVTIGLPLVSRSNPGGAAFANCILGVALAKLRKRDL